MRGGGSGSGRPRRPSWVWGWVGLYIRVPILTCEWFCGIQLKRICCTLSPKTTGVGISGRGCAVWFGKMVEATYLVKQALWSFQRNLKSFVLSNTERLPMSMWAPLTWKRVNIDLAIPSAVISIPNFVQLIQRVQHCTSLTNFELQHLMPATVTQPLSGLKGTMNYHLIVFGTTSLLNDSNRQPQTRVTQPTSSGVTWISSDCHQNELLAFVPIDIKS